jgi:hypothetical protein
MKANNMFQIPVVSRKIPVVKINPTFAFLPLPNKIRKAKVQDTTAFSLSLKEKRDCVKASGSSRLLHKMSLS